MESRGADMGQNQKSHRSYHTGSIEKREDGVYRLRVVIEDPAKRKLVRKSKTVKVPVRGNKTQLEEEMRIFQDELRQAMRSGSNATMDSLIEEWYKQKRKRAVTTMETYTRHIEKHIRPALGDIPLRELSARDLDRFYGDLDQKGLQPGTIRLVHSIVRLILTQAVKWSYIAANPASNTSVDKGENRTAPALTPGQVADLISAAQAKDPTLGIAFGLAASTGARRGELCGLKWSDVDWEAWTIHIERAWVPGEGGQHLTTTKTGKARTVALGDYGVTVLKAYHTHQLERWGALGEWLLSDGDGTHPFRARTLTTQFTALAKAQDVTSHFHELRHFAQTQLIGLGVDVKTAAARAGHSPKILLETYAHAIAERDQQAANLLGSVIVAALEKGNE